MTSDPISEDFFETSHARNLPDGEPSRQNRRAETLQSCASIDSLNSTKFGSSVSAKRCTTHPIEGMAWPKLSRTPLSIKHLVGG